MGPRHRRSTAGQQSAIELLSTYAWAFIIVALLVVAIGIYLGIAPSSQLVSSQCNIQPLLPCPQTLLAHTAVATQAVYKMLMVNNLAPYLYFASNTFIVTVTNAGITSSNYTGSCTPYLAAKGDEIICQANLPTSNLPSLGSSASINFKVQYQICSTTNVIQCPSVIYTTTGYSLQAVTLSPPSLYTLTLASSPNTTLVIG